MFCPAYRIGPDEPVPIEQAGVDAVANLKPAGSISLDQPRELEFRVGDALLIPFLAPFRILRTGPRSRNRRQPGLKEPQYLLEMYIGTDLIHIGITRRSIDQRPGEAGAHLLSPAQSRSVR